MTHHAHIIEMTATAAGGRPANRNTLRAATSSPSASPSCARDLGAGALRGRGTSPGGAEAGSRSRLLRAHQQPRSGRLFLLLRPLLPNYSALDALAITDLERMEG